MTAPSREVREAGDSETFKAVRAWLVSGRAIHEQWAKYLASDPVSRGELSQSAADELGNVAWHENRVVGYTRAIELLDGLWSGHADATAAHAARVGVLEAEVAQWRQLAEILLHNNSSRALSSMRELGLEGAAALKEPT